MAKRPRRVRRESVDSRVPSPDDVRQSIRFASNQDLISELLSRAPLAIVCVCGTPGDKGGLVGFRTPDAATMYSLLDGLSDNAEALLGG